MLLLRLVCNLWVKFIQHQISTADFFITFFASKKAAKDGHRAEFSEEELQVRGGPFRWGPQILSGCGNKLANSDFELFLFICSILFSTLALKQKQFLFWLGDEIRPGGIKPLEGSYQ